jgi:2-dehydro-3-deoxygluconokinase
MKPEHKANLMPRVATFGEAMLRLTPAGFVPLQAAQSLEVQVGGAELNTAAGLAALGTPATWISALPAGPLGERIRAAVRSVNVDDEGILIRPGRCGLYYLEPAAAPRPAAVTYDRAGSAFSLAADYDWPKLLHDAGWFHVTGITAAVAPPGVVMAALQECKSRNINISFDLNYRATLWTPERAAAVLRTMLPFVDTLICGEADAELLFGIRGTNFESVAKQLAHEFGCPHIAAVRRDAPVAWRNRYGAIGWSERTGLIETPLFDCEVVDRLGAGDAAAAGFIVGLLQNDFSRGLHLGAACGALKHTIPGDLPRSTLADAEAVLAGAGMRVRR